MCRPERWSAEKDSTPAQLVRFEPVRSAEPPSISGTCGQMAESAFWLALRVATVSAACCAPETAARTTSA